MKYKTILMLGCALGIFHSEVAAQWQTTGSDTYYNSGNVGIETATPAYPLDVNGNTRITTGWLWLTDNFAQFDNRVGIGTPPYGPNRIGDNDFQVNGSVDVNGSYGFVNSDKTSNWRFFPSGTDPLLILNMKTFGTPYAVVQVAGQAVNDPAIDESEATLALYRGNSGGSNSEFFDLYNNGYNSSRQHGIRIQKRGTGEYRPFIIDFSDGTSNLMAMKINTDLSSEFGGNIAVNGTANAEEIIVTETVGADFVFEKDYQLPALDEVKSYIQKNKHLSEIPSAKEMIENGVSVGELQIKLLQKIEELTLYVIELEEQDQERVQRMESLENKVDALLNRN